MFYINFQTEIKRLYYAEMAGDINESSRFYVYKEIKTLLGLQLNVYLFNIS